MKTSIPILALLVGCTNAEVQPAVATAVADAGQAQWAEAAAPGDTVMLEAPARVLAGPGSEAVVTTPMRATIIRVRVRAGDPVTVGAPLIDVLMPEALDAAGRFEGARARLAAWTERWTQLQQLRTEGLARSLDVSEAAARVAEAKADAQTARATLLAAGLKENDVAALLSGNGTTSLKAPVTGVITSINATVGESRDATSGALLQLASAGTVRIEARFPRPPPEGGWTLVTGSGRQPVSLISRAPTADPRDGTFVAWFEASGSAPVAGTLGRVTLETQQVADVVRVPARAVHRVGGIPTVMTRDASVSVDVLQCGGSDCLVRGALKPGVGVSLEAR